MKKTKRTLSLAVGLGLLMALSTIGQIGVSADQEDTLNLQLLITVNRLELSRDQMEAMHDLLDGVLDEANALKSDREAFEQEMLTFTGTAAELDAILDAHRKTMDEKATALRDTVKDALNQIKELLSMKQGEILEQSLPGFGLLNRFGAGRAADTSTPKGRFQQRGANQPEPQAQIMNRLRERLGGRFGTQGQEGTERPFDSRLLLLGARPLERPLSILEDLVNILEAKLQVLT